MSRSEVWFSAEQALVVGDIIRVIAGLLGKSLAIRAILLAEHANHLVEVC